MDFSQIFNKLPKRIQKSEKFLLYCMRFAKTVHNKNPYEAKNNSMLNFLFYSTNIEVKGTMKDIQTMYIELLRFIDNICKKHDLEYCLCYGTLLGAIRHEGFIPWDDDCDILMMRSDFNKMIKILPKEINKHKFFKENCALTRLINFNENYYSDFNNIYDKELGHDEYFTTDDNLGKSAFLQLGWLKPMIKLDIFPYDYIKEDSIEYYNKNYLGHKYYFRKLYHEKDFSFDKEFNERYKKLGLTPHETNFIAEGIDASAFDDFGVIGKDMIFPIRTIKFEGYDFKCPNKPHNLLKLWYGDGYMNIPEKIRVHSYVDYNLTLFKSEEEMNQSFKEAITYLKEVNDNFE